MLVLTCNVGTDGPAAMFVRIDERRQSRRTFERRIERKPDFGKKRHVGPEASRDNQFIGDHVASAAGRAGADPQMPSLFAQVRHVKTGLDLQATVAD